MGVTYHHNHGRLAQYAMYGSRVAALEQLLLVLEYEVVQLLVTRDDGRGAEEMRLEDLPIPTQVSLQSPNLSHGLLSSSRVI